MAIIQKLRDMFGTRELYQINISPEQVPYVDGLSARGLYATQANLHTVVSFLADSVAQLPLKVYTRDGETDRNRDRNSVAAKLLYRPNADQTSYEFINALMTELLLMGVATIWLLKDADSESGYQLRIIPREWIESTEQVTNYAPDVLKVRTNTSGRYIEIPRTEFVQFRMYSPGNPAGYQSPISALRQTLSEQINADRFRNQVWRSSGRFNAYITRPANVQPWDENTRETWIKAFRDAWGSGGPNAGKMPVLEDGMEIKPYQFNAQQAQYAETKQLSREDVAAAYHINPSLIWHTTTQTYASAKDNARALYADCLGPILQMLQQRINSFLLPMVGADPNTYVEFDLAEKLKGSFEERATVMQTAVGGPWMTRNEARADNNLPPIEGGDQLIVPLNVLEGGQVSGFNEAEPECKCCAPHKEHEIRIKGRSDEDEDEEMAKVIESFLRRQAKSVLPKMGAKAAEWWDEDRWNKELAKDLIPVMQKVSDKHGKEAADIIGSDYVPELTRKYIEKAAEGKAKGINKVTQMNLEANLESDEDEQVSSAEIFEKRQSDAANLGRQIASVMAGWALTEAVAQADTQGIHKTVMKEWVTGDNPRSSHARMNGERVPIDSTFSNGAMWPGDLGLPEEESCGCNCTMDVIII